MANKSKQRKSKKYNHRSAMDKTIQKSLKGFFIKFTLIDPLGEHDQPCQVQVGSTNPVVQLRLKNDAFWDCMRHVLDSKKLKWKILISMQFTKDGKTEYKEREIVGVARLPDLDDDYQGTIEAMFAEAEEKNYMKNYVQTDFCQQVLPGQEIKDCDFSPD
jgi:hypothetical protein